MKYYLDIYEKENIYDMVNYRVFQTYPFPIPTQNNIRYKHYYTSFWERWKNRDLKKKHVILFDADEENEIKTIFNKDEVVWHYYKNFEYLKDFYKN